MDIEIVHARSNKPLVSLNDQVGTNTVGDVKRIIASKKAKYRDVNRQELRMEPKGKALKDEDTLASLNLNSGAMLYFKDRGVQIGWITVFLCEYAGPLFVYLWFYRRPWLAFGEVAAESSEQVVHIAAACWTFHYAKRILETLFVHRFSNATMPLMNLFKNCSYYWGFAAYIGYHINHPLFTAPCVNQMYAGLAGFALCELGNFSIHLLLRNLRPAGSKVRKIPYASVNPLTWLFKFVSCPNYTYEIGAWISFAVMTQCLPVGFFTLAGGYQMAMWALGKHRNYRKEFKDYPSRKAIIPFVL